MAELPDPKSRKESYLAKAAGKGGVTLPAKPESRIEQYLEAIAQGGGGGGGGSAELKSALTASITVGGVSAGKSYGAGTELETILRDMLAPSLNPTLTNPSATMTGSGAKLLECGVTASATMTISFNRGSINPAYGTSGYRSGEATGYKLNGGASQSGNTFNVTVSESNNTFTGTVDYAAGEQPKNSKGDNYGTPLPAGFVNTSAVTYEFVNAFYATTVNIDTMTKQPLVSKSAKQYTFNMKAVTQTSAKPMMFDIPNDYNITAVQGFNAMTGQWQNISDFRTEATTHEDAAGNTVNYTRYIDDRGYGAAGREIKVIWS